MMLIDDFLERVDWKKMIYGGLGALVLFIFIAVGIHLLFGGSAVSMKKTEFEFGEEVNILEYIDSIDGEKVYPAMIKDASTLILESREVQVSPIDPYRLGQQILEIRMTDSVTGKQSKPMRVKIRVIDTTSPEMILKDQIETDIDSFRELSPEDLIESVSDQCTDKANIKLSMRFDSSAEPGKTLKGTVIATDESGNSTALPVTVKIKDLTVIEQEHDKKDDSPEQSEQQQISQPEQSETPAPPVQTVPDPAPEPEMPVYTPVPEPEPEYRPPFTKFYMFTDGYNMGNVENACVADGEASGMGYTCTPIQENGIYTGMMLQAGN